MASTMMHRLVQLLLMVTFIHYSLCDCMEKMKRCHNSFESEMKAVKFATADNEYRQIYYDICSNEGIYDRFVNCVQPLSGQCDKQPKFRQTICSTRSLKMSTTRYNWKPNFVHDICYRVSPVFDAEVFKHEKCIATVMNARDFSCEPHYKRVKETNGQKSCTPWKEFRACTFTEIERQCGNTAANVSDFMFHVHGSYFTKYTVCKLPGETFTDCWYDWLQKRLPSTTMANVTMTPTIQSVVANSTQPGTERYTVPASETKSTYAWTKDPTLDSTGGDQSVSESTQWSKSSESKHDSLHKEESSSQKEEFYENSINEEKTSESEHDEDEDDHENDQVVDSKSEEFEEKRKFKKKEYHRGPAYSPASSIPLIPNLGHELYLNDADLKTNGTAEHEASAQQMDKSSVSVRESKASPMETDASRKETVNLASVSQPAGNGVSGLSSLLSFFFSFLLLFFILA